MFDAGAVGEGDGEGGIGEESDGETDIVSQEG